MVNEELCTVPWTMDHVKALLSLLVTNSGSPTSGRQLGVLVGPRWGIHCYRILPQPSDLMPRKI